MKKPDKIIQEIKDNYQKISKYSQNPFIETKTENLTKNLDEYLTKKIRMMDTEIIREIRQLLILLKIHL